MQLGKLGVWAWLDGFEGPQAAGFAKEIEALGYGALWVPEAVGRDPFALLGFLAAHTDRLNLCTGIANIYARDAHAMHHARKTMAGLSEGRFVLGLGVSHGHLVSKLRGHEYSSKPVSTMRAYLEELDKALYMGVEPKEEAPVLLGALRKNMLRLSAEKAQGAHPYFVPPEHTARAREILGPDAILAPEQKVLLCTDPAQARAIARAAMKVYVIRPNYQNNLRWLGYDDADFEGGGSDRLVDAIVAWGDEEAIARRVQEHWDAGASHVCIQAIDPEGGPLPHVETLRALAPAA